MPPGEGRPNEPSVPVEQIDPSRVPDWPHPVVTVSPEGVDVDGRPLDLPPGVVPESSEARQWALRTVAAQYAGLNRPVKVRARDADGTGWDLVVSQDGSVVPVSDVPVEYPGGKAPRRRDARKPARRRQGRGSPAPDKRRGLVAMVVFVVVVVAIGATAVTVLRHGNGGPTPTRTGASTPAAANLPVPPPPGFTNRADWALPLKEQTGVAVVPGGGVAFVNGDGDLEVRDARTGVLRWKMGLPLNAQGELHTTQVDGREVLALGGQVNFWYWVLDDPKHTTHSVSLPDGAAVSFTGRSPLVVLPNQTAAYITGDEAKLVDVPVGARPVSTDGTSVIAVDAHGRMWHLHTGHGAPPAPTPLHPPARHATVLRAVELASGMFLVAWKYGSIRMAILYDSPGGAKKGQKPLDAAALGQVGGQSGEDTVHAADDASVVTLGDMVVFPNVPKAYTIAGLTARTVGAGHLYGTETSGKWLDQTVQRRASVAGEASVPVAVSGSTAFVAAQKLDQTLLYALPTTAGPSQSQRPSPTTTTSGGS